MGANWHVCFVRSEPHMFYRAICPICGTGFPVRNTLEEAEADGVSHRRTFEQERPPKPKTEGGTP